MDRGLDHRKSSWNRFHLPPITPHRGQPRRTGAHPGCIVTTGLLRIWPTQSEQQAHMQSVQAKQLFKNHGRPQLAQITSKLSERLPVDEDWE